MALRATSSVGVGTSTPPPLGYVPIGEVVAGGTMPISGAPDLAGARPPTPATVYPLPMSAAFRSIVSQDDAMDSGTRDADATYVRRMCASLIPDSRAEDSLRPPRHGTYRDANELNPLAATPILRHANGGMYIAVGTERGFIGAARTDASHLMLIDYDAEVLRYNRFNVALLKASVNRRHYLALRTVVSEDMFRELVSRSAVDLPVKRYLLAHWRWWFENVLSSNLKDYSNVSLLHANSAEGFRRCNYLYDDVIFDHLHDLAMDDRIQVYGIDLSAAAQVDAFAGKLAQGVTSGRYTLGVIDLSNAWLENYINKSGVAHIVERMAALGAADASTILLLTIFGRRKDHWRYFGTTFEHLAATCSDDLQRAVITDIDRSMMAIGAQVDRLRRLFGHLASGVTSAIDSGDLEVYAFNGKAGIIKEGDRERTSFGTAVKQGVAAGNAERIQLLLEFGEEVGFAERAGVGMWKITFEHPLLGPSTETIRIPRT